MVNSPIKAEDLATEFSVVRNEFESGENSPQRVLSQRMAAVAYEWHNYGKSTIGNRSDIERVPVDNLRAFYKKFYQPDNAMLVVAGKFDEKKALEYITKYFGSLPRPDRKLPPLTPKSRRKMASDRDPAPGWRRRSGRFALSRAGRRMPSSRGCRSGQHPRIRALGAAVQGTGGVEDGHSRFGRSLRPPRSRKSSRSSRASTRKTRQRWKKSATPCSRSWPTCQVGGHPGRGRSCPPEDPQESRAGRRRSQRHRRSALRVGRTRRLAALFPQPRPDREGDAAEEVKEVAVKYFGTSNRTVGYFIPTDKPERTPIPAVPDIAKLVDGYKGRQMKAESSEAADVQPAWPSRPGFNGPSRSEGSRSAFLPKKTRGGSVELQLTLHYGNADNLKGLTEAAGFLRPLMSQETKT